MANDSGRPDLDDVAEDRAAARHPRVVDAAGDPPPATPGDTYGRVFVQSTQPITGSGPYVWFQTDQQGNVTDILVEA